MGGRVSWLMRVGKEEEGCGFLPVLCAMLSELGP